jgi:hypothetical protein
LPAFERYRVFHRNSAGQRAWRVQQNRSSASLNHGAVSGCIFNDVRDSIAAAGKIGFAPLLTLRFLLKKNGQRSDF